MSDPLRDALAAARREGRAALGLYAVAGDPDPERSLLLFEALLEAGADFLEVGIPAEDGALDGAAIREAFGRARDAGVRAEETLALVAALAARRPGAAIVLMGYAGDLASAPPSHWARRAREVGAAALLLPDVLPGTVGDGWRRATTAEGLGWVPLVDAADAATAPLPDPATSPFIYLKPSHVRTGESAGPPPDALAAAATLRVRSAVPVGLGFSVRTPAHAAAAARAADAVIVGSAVVGRVADALAENSRRPIRAFVQGLRIAMDAARHPAAS